MKHSLPTDIINKVLAYLASKTFSEVADLISEIKAKAEILPGSAQVESSVVPAILESAE